jgi:hypothetical protein
MTPLRSSFPEAHADAYFLVWEFRTASLFVIFAPAPRSVPWRQIFARRLLTADKIFSGRWPTIDLLICGYVVISLNT